MPRALVSDWKRVATSGKTADGRTIDPQDLRDMADAYDPDTYTAVIWFEHIRYMGNFGRVTEVKVEDLEDGKVRLFAKLAPNNRLLEINKEAQKLFASIEIQPDFSDTGKPYLVGLAVTDSPASLGTEPLHFSSRAGDGNHFGSLEPLGDLTPTDVGDESALSFFARLFSQMGLKESSVPLKDETPAMDPKTAEAFAAVVDKLDTVATSLEKSATTFAVQKPEAPAAPEKTEKTEKAEPASVLDTPSTPVAGISIEQFDSLKGSLEKLTESFNTALNQGKGKDVPKTLGAVEDNQEDVY